MGKKNEKKSVNRAAHAAPDHHADIVPGMDSNLDEAERLKQDINRHIVSSLGNDYTRADRHNVLRGLILAVRERLISRWIWTQRTYYDVSAKRVYYLSLEYLPGRSLVNNLLGLGLLDPARKAVEDLGYDLDDLSELEMDAGLGNGGLGRLASCFMDSLATLNIPGYGYGIRYDFGIFHQRIEDGYQVEQCDNWLQTGNLWEFTRPLFMYDVHFHGRVRESVDALGNARQVWTDTQKVKAMACDMLVPGYGTNHVINMRLWSARASDEFNLRFFNAGDYIGAVHDKVLGENISKVLYPSEEAEQGRELRLKQQYFFVSATLQDILRRFKKRKEPFTSLPDVVAIQLNETHPSIAIPELMRILVDEERSDWDTAWDICRRTFAYTNHTIMPEALETWPVDLIERVLPRHLQIIYEINHRFLEELRAAPAAAPDTIEDTVRRMSIIGEQGHRHVRMAHLAIVGSHSVNGVSALHTDIIRASVFKDFHDRWPDRFNNKTNGITPRLWLNQCNRRLSRLIKEHIGREWITHLDKLKDLEELAGDKGFRAKWREAKLANKKALADYVLRKTGLSMDPESLVDVHVKRIHEYKRQILNILHVITLYNRIRDTRESTGPHRTVIFGGKAAPAYHIAKMTIKLVNAVAHAVNNDPLVGDRLKVVFLPNYCVSSATKIVPATDLSEQISTAGTEASGTGNMKFALNGALIIGTLDGANIEIMEEVGEKNIFIFGHTAEELAALARDGYNPWSVYEGDLELKRAVDMIANGHFAPGDADLFKPVLDTLLLNGDPFRVLADYRDYVDCQQRVAALYDRKEEWTRRSILNTARMGMFSSDRTIREYAEDIWDVHSLT